MNAYVMAQSDDPEAWVLTCDSYVLAPPKWLQFIFNDFPALSLFSASSLEILSVPHQQLKIYAGFTVILMHYSK